MRNLRICFTLTSGHFHRDFPAAARQFHFVSSKASVFRWLEYSLTFRFCAVQYQHGRYAHVACLKSRRGRIPIFTLTQISLEKINAEKISRSGCGQDKARFFALLWLRPGAMHTPLRA